MPPATATTTRAATRSSTRKKHHHHQNKSEDNETTATTRTRSTTQVPLEREAIEEDLEDDCAMSPLRSMQNLEDVTLTFTTTTTATKSGGRGNKAIARTPKTRSTKKKKSKKTTTLTEDKAFEEPPFSPLMRLDSNLDDEKKGGGREKEEFEKEDEEYEATTMPQSTHKRWVDDDRSPIVTRGGHGGGVGDGTRDGAVDEDENEGFKLDFLDPAEEEEEDVIEEEAALKEETYENVDATEEILARVNARNLTWHKQPERAKFYGGVVEFGQQQSQMMGTLSASTPGFRCATADGAAHRGIPPTPLANTAVPWPNEHTNEGMDTEAFLNGIASFRGGGGNNDNVSRGEGPLPRTPIFQHQRTPISGGGGGGVGNIRTNLYVPHQNRDEMFGNPNEREKQPPSSDEKLSAELRRTKTEILDCQDRRKRLRDTLVALREKEEKLYAKAAEMQRELLRRDPSRSLELGGASIFDAIPPLGDDVVREEKAEVKKERDVAAATGVARDEEDAEEAPTTSTKNSEKDAEEEHDAKENQLEEDRRNEEATASTSARNFTSKMSQTYDVHRNVLSMQFLDPSSWLDGQTSLLAASADDVIRLYASDSRKPFALIRTEKGMSCVGTTLNDRVAYCATKFGGVSQIDLATGEKIGTVVQNFEQLRVNKSIDCMATSSSTGTDDNILVCAGEGSAIRVWDARCANFGAAPLTFHAPGARNVSSVALAAGGSGHTTLLASAPTSGLFAFDLRVNSSSSSPGVRGGGGQISRLSVPNFEKQPRWVNAKFCAANEIFAIACDGNAATFEASGEFKATSAFAGVSAPFQMASPSSSSPLFSSSRHYHRHQSFVKTGGILEVSSDGEHVLVSTGDIGSGVQCFNTSTGAVVASWDPALAADDENSRNPLSCACWGHAGAARNQPFGQDAFAIADATGNIKVFGVHA